MSISVDGFVAGSNGELDWIFRNSSEESRKWAAGRLGEMGLHAMGRAAYEGMADYWPSADGPFARPMNAIPKAVFSRSGAITPPSMERSQAAGADPVAVEGWRHPRVLGSDFVLEIERLKAEDGKPIHVLGGASFASSLLAEGLVDVIRLSTHPIVLGQGLPIFAGLESPLDLKLEDLRQFDTGVVVKTYRVIDRG